MKLTARQHRIIDPPRETAVPAFPVRKFTVAEHHQLLKVGILKSGDPYELLEGWIVPKVKRRPQECYAINKLHQALRELVAGDEWFAGTQYPITFPRSEPEPSCSVIRGANRDYSQRHPHPREIELVAEVSESSLERDQGLKMQIYASGSIAQYWIVNLVDRRVEVYTQPKGGKTRTDYGPDAAVPVVVAGKRVGTIAVKELLP